MSQNDSATQFMQKELAVLQEADITAHYPQTFAVQPLLEKKRSVNAGKPFRLHAKER